MLLTMLFSRWALIPEKLGGGSVTGLLKLLLYFRKNYMVFTTLFKHFSQASKPFFPDYTLP